MLWLSWRLALVACVTLPATWLAGKVLVRISRRLYRARQAALGEINALAEEMISGQHTVQAFCREPTEEAAFARLSDRLRVLALRAEVAGGVMGPVMNALGNVSYLLVAAFGGWFVLNGTASVGLVISFLLYARQFGRPVNEIASQFGEIQSAIAGAERVFRTTDEPPEPGVYSTCLDASEAFKDTGKSMDDAVLRAKADGYRYMFLIPTCSSEIMGADLAKSAEELSARHRVEVIPVAPDPVFLSSKFGGTFGLFDALISRMKPRPVEKGTVNLVARWFYGIGKERSMSALRKLLSLFDLRIRFGLLDFCNMADIEDFCAAEYDFQIGRAMLNRRIGEKISEATGRRLPLEMDVPVGLSGCLEWVSSMAEYDPEFAAKAPLAEKKLRAEFDTIAQRYWPYIQGKKLVIYCIMVRDLKWQVETLRALGADIRAVMFVDGPVIDHNVRIPDYGDVEVMTSRKMCDLRRLMSEEDIDMVLTNDSDRVRREGFRYAPLGTRFYGMEGVDYWARNLVDSLNVPIPTWEGGL